VDRRRLRDRDPDERRIERERDERRHGAAVPEPVDLGDDDRDAGRPSPEQRALLGSAVFHGAERISRS
jgi:hypothetical protein